jgi:transketolase
VKIVSVGAGFAYGNQGMSHHATEDIAIMRALPGITIFSPCDPAETEAVVNYAYELDGPCYLRLGKGGETILHNSTVAECNMALALREGKDTAIVATGAITGEALIAAEHLEKLNIDCAVYSFPMIKPIDTATILMLAGKFDYLFTLEEHNIMGGFGSTVAEVVAEHPKHAAIIRLGLHDEFASEVGSLEYMRSYYRINAINIEEEIRKRL